jgi:hypothetical protein
MNVYEREYFVSRIRSGVHRLKVDDQLIKVKTPTIEDKILSDEVFFETLIQAQKDGLKTEEETNEWMLEKGLWTLEKEKKLEDMNKGLDTLKVQIFNFRNQERERENTRVLIRATEKTIRQFSEEKNSMFSKSCEGVALNEKVEFLMSRTCYIDDQLADLEYVNMNSLMYQYNQAHCSEKDLREIARNDPWRLCWNTKEFLPLFYNEEGRDLTVDQKSLLIWSRMYDNIQESMECPTEDVINDDDMLDGWFIVQRRKAQADKAKSELESRTSNPKIANSDEVIVVADSVKEAAAIESMNSVHGDTIRRQRIAQVKRQGRVQDSDLQDKQLEMRAQANNAVKERFRR